MTTQTKTTLPGRSPAKSGTKAGWRKAIIYSLIFFDVVVFAYLSFFLIDFLFSFWRLLNESAGAVQAVSTAVLVGITAFYALQVQKTNKLISIQIYRNKPINNKNSYYQ